MKKKILSGSLLLAALAFAACTEVFDDNFQVERPQDLAAYDYLKDYDVLKNYVDRNASPNFKLGLALEAGDFNNGGQYYVLAASNFDEITAGNAMKYASNVSDRGVMDFTTVTNFINKAREAGLTVYGHTLAWHSQQQPKYLNGLIADREIEVDPDAQVDVEDGRTTFADYGKFPFFVMGYEPEIKDGCLVSNNPTEWHQYFVMDGLSTVPDRTYTVTARMCGTEPGSLNVQLGNWGALQEGRLEFSTEMKEYSITIAGITTSSSFVVFQPGTYPGEITIEYVKLTHSEAPVMEIPVSLVSNGDAEGTDVENFISTEAGGQSVAGCIIVDGAGVNGSRAFVVDGSNNAGAAENWDTQFFIRANEKLYEGDKLHVAFKYRADKEAGSESQTHGQPGGYIHWDGGLAVNFTPEWQQFDKTLVISASQAGADGMQTFAFNLAVLRGPNKYYFDDIVVEKIISANTIPLTDEEKKAVLTEALDTWIGGMMQACDGYVTAWDVVNEAIAGDGDCGDGFYPLQSGANGGANDFFWQDYLGSEDYVRIAVKSARDHFAENGGDASKLKLFINDYNLESDWDDNKKLKSLIHWIEKWESDGVTKIDGIGTQMHVSFYADPNKQKSKEEHVVKMLQLMAATGKLVKISELDMGYVDTNDNTLMASELTEEQHKQMAGFYTFIVKKYFELIPAAQQYGITQWCATDAPGNASTNDWRGGQPVGLWTRDFQRKHTYAGFADGLAGK